MSVYAKLNEARLRLQNAPLKKSGHNKFAGYHYFELGDFLPTVQTIFNDLGLCGVVSYTDNFAILDIVDTEDGQKITISSPMGSAALKGCHEVQNIGAVETYQRRYLWVTAMEIVENDVLDATTGSKDVKPTKITPTTGAWEEMDEESQAFLQKLADEVLSIVIDGDIQAAYSHLHSQHLTTEEKAALWTRFDSKVRAALTKEGQRVKEQKKAA